MTARVSPTERIRAEIDALMVGAERASLLEHFEEVARACGAAGVQNALEEELTEFLGLNATPEASAANRIARRVQGYW